MEPEDEDPEVSYFVNMTKDLTKKDIDLLHSLTVKRLQQVLIGGKQNFSGNKTEPIQRIRDFVYDRLYGAPCTHMTKAGELNWAWGGNKDWSYAHCRRCGRQVELQRRRPAVPLVKAPRDVGTLFLEPDGDVLWCDLKANVMIGDSGCRR